MKTLNIILAVALMAAIVYGFVTTVDKNALNTKLESVQGVLITTQAELSKTESDLTKTQTELNSVKQTLTSTEAELSSTQETLSSTQTELGATKTELDAIETKLKLYEDTMGIEIFSGVQPHARGAGPIELVNNSAATDPSWQQLISFLRADSTDDRTWTEGIFVSGDFAEMLHNNAESAGIRAAVVGVFFEGESIGHGLNAFKTTDRGLVYVDCTGPTLQQRLEESGTPIEWDKIAFVTKGKEYGLVSLEQDTPIDYTSYEKMKADWRSYPSKLEAYNQEVAEYNSAYSRYKSSLEESLSSTYSWQRQLWLSMADSTQRLFELRYGRTFEEEEKYLKEQREWLNSIRAQLEKAWEPLGTTKNIEIYW